jgi:hypothetical protein
MRKITKKDKKLNKQLVENVKLAKLVLEAAEIIKSSRINKTIPTKKQVEDFFKQLQNV